MIEQKPPTEPNWGAFVGGVVAGIPVGCIVAFLAFLLIGMLLSDFSGAPIAPFASAYLIGIGCAVGGYFVIRKHTGFWAGLLIGGAAGALGITALCNAIVGLGNMH